MIKLEAATKYGEAAKVAVHISMARVYSLNVSITSGAQYHLRTNKIPQPNTCVSCDTNLLALHIPS